MNTPARSILSLSISTLILGGAFAPQAGANTDLYWDADGSSSAATGGTGIWNTSTALWRLGASSGALQNYDNTIPSIITAHLGGTAGTLTIASGVTINVNSLVFDAGASGNYTVAGADSTSILNFSGTGPTIANNFGGIETISAKITGSSGFTLTGGNFTVLTGDLSGLTGTVNVNGRINLQGSTVAGTQNQTWNIASGQNLTSNNKGTGSTIQLGALSGAGQLRPGNDNTAGVNGTDNFQIGALNTNTTFSGSIVNFTSGLGGTALGAITKVGTGTLTLTGTGNTYTGGTTISAGTLEIGDGTTNGSTTGTYSIGSSGTLRLNYATAVAPSWANMTGAGKLSIKSAAANSDWGSPALAAGFTGTLQIESGRLNNGTLGGATAVVVLNGGQYANWNGGTFSQNFTIAGTGWGESGYESALRFGNTTLNGTVALSASATIASGGTALLTNVISGASGSNLTIGTSQLASSIIFSGANTYAGNTIISFGTLQIGNAGTAGSLGSGNVIDNAALIFNRTDGIIVGNAISGTGTVTQAGSGNLALTGANSYGNTSVNAGSLSVGEVTGVGANGTSTSLGGGSVNVAAGAQLILAGKNLNIANNITLNGAATVSGRQGALVGGFQDGSNNNTVSGTLTLAGTGDRTVSTWWSDKTLTLSGKVTGAGTLRVVNVSSTSSNGGSIVYLSNATNDFTGGVTVDGGGNGSTQTLRLGASNVIPDGAGKGDVTVNGRLELLGFTDTINGLNGSGVVEAGSTLLTVGNNNASGTFLGAFNSSVGGGLIKTGSATQTLSGTSDNSGGRAQVNAGTLVLGKTSSSGVHAVGSTGGTDYALVITGGTAKLGGTGGDQIYQNSAVNMTGGTLDLAGLSEGFDGLSGSGGTITNSTSSTTSTLTLGQNNSSGSPVFGGIIQNGSGTVALTKTGTGTQTLSGANTYSGRTSVNAGTLAITAGGISGGNVGQTIIVNDAGSGTATMTQSGGTVSAGTGEIWIGQNSGSTGIYNLSGGSLNSSNWFAIGRNFATGTLNITGSGALTHTGSNVTIGSGGGGAGNGTVNQTGGSFTDASEVWLGETGTANYNISGGTVNANGGLKISRGANPGTLTLQNATGTTGGLANGGGNEVFTTTTLLMSESTGASTVNLDGGTLVVTQIASAGGTGTKTFNFNGGTLKANSGASAAFMAGLTNAFVKSAGAVIDTNGQAITIAQSLLTDVSSTGGGLTKNGAGTLTLSGANTYTGGTTLSVGTLAVANNNALGTDVLNMGNGTTLANFDTVAHTLTNNIVFGSVAGMTATFSTSNDLTFSGSPWSMSGGTNGIQITKTGTGTLTIPDTAQTVGSGAAPAVWTVTGGGTLALTRGNNLGTLPSTATTQVILDNGTFRTITAGGNFFPERKMQVNAAGGTWLDSGGGVNFDGAVANSGPFTINTPVTNATTLLNGAVSGSGSLIKAGAGTLSLTAANTYSGVTTINAGTLNLTGSFANTAISVASGASFSPTQTTSAGLSSGSAGASLTLNSGAIFDMTSVSAGTINTFTLNPGSNTFAGQALSLASANLRFDLGSSSADRLQVNKGTATVSGTNNIRFNTGSSLTTGTYTLIGTTAASGLAGNFQFDGGSSLSAPAQQQIKQVGGTYYRLTLQNSGTAEQVVVSAAPSNIINIMPLGSSITEGVSSEGATYNGGGYRSQLYQNLVNDGRFTPHFVGSQTVLDASNSTGYNVLTGANELNHEGHSGYTTTQILKNLNDNGGDGGNNGGFWLAPSNGKNPDYVTLSIGGNDYGANNTETTGPLNRTDAIVSQIQSLRPDAQIIVSNLFYRTQNVGGIIVGDLQNTYYNPGVQGMVFNHVLAGQHVSFNDAYSAVTPGGSMSHIFDGIHPDTVGYQAFANSWYDALANGSAYWTGASGGQWSTSTNFAQNYQLTTPRQGALGASTDVHFNSNANPLNTTLGGNISVRSVNFADGADGSVTIGGNTLTLGAGGITVQAGTGAHTISSNVVLGTDQTWGNVSSNPFTVTGNISGSANLTIVGSAVVQLPGTLSGGTYTTMTQTVSGTGAIVLSGANTYTGTTTISSGTLQIGNSGTTGSLSTSSAITNNGALVFNRTDTVTQGTHFSAAAITGTGSLTQAGAGTLVLNAANTFTGATTVSGGTLSAAAAGALGATSGITVNSSGTLLLAGAAAIDRVNNAAGLTLAGGTLSMAGLSSASETMGALTLTGNSTIDFGTGNGNSLTFDTFSLGTFSLTVLHWTGIPYATSETTDHGDGTQDRLLFSNSPSLDAVQLSRISFFDDAGGFLGTGKEVSFGFTPELVPVPEPSTWMAAAALLGLVGYRERRRRIR